MKSCKMKTSSLWSWGTCSLVMQGSMKFSSGMFAMKRACSLAQLVIVTHKVEFPPEENERSLLVAQNSRVLKEQNISERWKELLKLEEKRGHTQDSERRAMQCRAAFWDPEEHSFVAAVWETIWVTGRGKHSLEFGAVVYPVPLDFCKDACFP